MAARACPHFAHFGWHTCCPPRRRAGCTRPAKVMHSPWNRDWVAVAAEAAAAGAAVVAPGAEKAVPVSVWARAGGMVAGSSESLTSSAFFSLDRACPGCPWFAPLCAELWPRGPTKTLTLTISRKHGLANVGSKQFPEDDGKWGMRHPVFVTKNPRETLVILRRLNIPVLLQVGGRL
jgi:hypothetical protein